jgi:hypothetical protein
VAWTPVEKFRAFSFQKPESMLYIFLLADRFARPCLGRPEKEVGERTFAQPDTGKDFFI